MRPPPAITGVREVADALRTQLDGVVTLRLLTAFLVLVVGAAYIPPRQRTHPRPPPILRPRRPRDRARQRRTYGQRRRATNPRPSRQPRRCSQRLRRRPKNRVRRGVCSTVGTARRRDGGRSATSNRRMRGILERTWGARTFRTGPNPSRRLTTPIGHSCSPGWERSDVAPLIAGVSRHPCGTCPTCRMAGTHKATSSSSAESPDSASFTSTEVHAKPPFARTDGSRARRFLWFRGEESRFGATHAHLLVKLHVRHGLTT